MSLGSSRQADYEVHTDIFPFPGWDRQRLKRSCYSQMTRLDPLASVALGHVFGDFPLHSGPPEILPQVLIHLAAARVNRKLGQVSFVHYHFAEVVILGHNNLVSKPKYSPHILPKTLVFFL